jgi:hypothetical protein
MNQSIICGFKYINKQTGEFFIDEHNKIHPRSYSINNKIHLASFIVAVDHRTKLLIRLNDYLYPINSISL